jgi:putative ABC transport system permease protein
MGFPDLIFKNALRHKLRSMLTILGIAIAILAFGLLRTVIDSWYSGVEASNPNRIVIRNAVSLAFSLPVSYHEMIQSIPGVQAVSYAHWFAGIYIDEKHSFFPQFAVEASPEWFDIFPEVVIPKEQKENFLKERNAAIVGIKLAQRNGWQIGQTIRMRGTFFPGDWEFVIRGIYTGATKSTDETWFVLHWQYMDERLRQTEPWRAGHVGWFTAKIADPNLAGEMSQAIDQRFKNSLAETLTETERSFMAGFVSMSSAIILALQTISIVIIAVILAVLSNTMAMAARERLTEYAVLKTLGFGARHLVFLIIGESFLISVFGGILGVVLSYPAAQAFWTALGDLSGALFPAFEVSPLTLAFSGLITMGIGLIAGLFPTWRAVTLRIAEGLRRIN